MPRFQLRFGPRARAHGALLALALSAGCALDRNDLAVFRHTATGPDKLRAILASSDRDGALRAEAALALLDLPRDDVDGHGMLFRELRSLPEPSKRDILPRFKEGLSVRMQTQKGRALSRTALRAKNAGGKLLAMLGEQERAVLGEELLQFMAGDLAQRGDAGSYSFEQIADQVGPASAPTLIAALNESMDLASVGRIAQAIDAHAAPADRAKAATRLLAVEHAFRGRASQGDRETSPGLLSILDRFTDQPAVRARLVGIAKDQALTTAERTRALSLLKGRTGEAELPALLELAQDRGAPPSLRALALTRAGETGSREVLPVCFVLVADREHRELRQRAGELAIAMGKAEGAVNFFRNLPNVWEMVYEKSELDAYAAQLEKLPLDFTLRVLFGAKLHSPYWWNRVMALHYFAARGAIEDMWRIRQHVQDDLLITGPGYPQGRTIGQEAESALAMALARLRGTPSPSN